MKRRVLRLSRGFTLIELLVVIGIVVLAIAFLLPTGCANKERANRVKCASNLRQIGQALMLYANDNKGNYPRVNYDPNAPLTCFTGPANTNPFTLTNDVTAAMFLLVRNCDLNPEVFVCPSSNQDKDTLNGLTAKERSNFQDNPAGQTLSYSMANMYPSTAVVNRGYNFRSAVIADLVIAADRNECRNRASALDCNTATTSQIKEMNSISHDGEGQNVLYEDGHVEWCTSPFVGVKKDHIYTQQDGKGLSSGAVGDGQPRTQYDTVLLPYWDNGQPKPRP